MTWSQVCDPLNSGWLSTLFAAVPVVVLLVQIASGTVNWACRRS